MVAKKTDVSIAGVSDTKEIVSWERSGLHDIPQRKLTIGFRSGESVTLSGQHAKRVEEQLFGDGGGE